MMFKKQGISYLWAEGDFSETLLYGNFLSVRTDQEDLRPAHLKHEATNTTTNINVCLCFHRLAGDGACGEYSNNAVIKNKKQNNL